MAIDSIQCCWTCKEAKPREQSFADGVDQENTDEVIFRNQFLAEVDEVVVKNRKNGEDLNFQVVNKCSYSILLAQ